MSSGITIRPQRLEDGERVVEIENASFPDQPPITIEEFRHNVASLPPEARRVALVAERDGEMIGRCISFRVLETTERDIYRFFVLVHPDTRGQGAGTALYDAGYRDLKTSAARRILSHVREGDDLSLRFATARGFRPTGHGDRLSRLDVASAHLDRCREADEQVRAVGIRIVTLAELGTEESVLRSIWELESRSSRDMPGSIAWEGLSYERWHHFLLEGPGTSPEQVWIALDGDQPIGLACLPLRGAGQVGMNSYTGVDARYRGKGIARALKLRTVEWAQAHGLTAIFTGNDVENAPMLAINTDLGYHPLPAILELEKDMNAE